MMEKSRQQLESLQLVRKEFLSVDGEKPLKDFYLIEKKKEKKRK
ncbi:MAG: hypothetical protein JWN60_2273 [Acidobacteria bacterium]|jgi:hypothetical protein|nr:hypothetical protein [Acidobacteriota bacterium]